jgi:hypothetical protein
MTVSLEKCRAVRAEVINRVLQTKPTDGSTQ